MLKQLQANRANREEIPDAQFGGAVGRWLRKHRAMLIGDVVHFCVQGLESKDLLPGLFDHVVIDEYRDLNALEQELVNHIWSKSGVLLVMSDDYLDWCIFPNAFDRIYVKASQGDWSESARKYTHIGSHSEYDIDMSDWLTLRVVWHY